MSKTTPGNGDDSVTINIQISFNKKTEVAHPGTHSLHPVEIICLENVHEPIIIEPLRGLHHLDRPDTDALIRKRATERAIISLALAVADIQFDESISSITAAREMMRRCGHHNPHHHPHPHTEEQT